MLGIRPPVAPRSTTTLLVVLILSAAPLTGCIGQDTSPVSSSTLTGSDGEETTPDTPAETLSFEPDTTWTVRWENGSFSPHEITAGENGPPVADAQRMDEHWFDVSEMIPGDAPVRLTATLTHDEDPLADLNTFIATWGNPIYRFESQDDPGRYQVDTTIAQTLDEPIEVVANANEPNLGAETPYQLRIEVQPLRDHVPADAPTAVAVPASAEHLEVQPLDEDTRTGARIWSPEDVQLAHKTTEDNATLTLLVDGDGHHVVMTTTPSVIRLLDADGQPVAAKAPLTPLGWAFETGEARTIDPATPGAQTVGFELDRAPVSVGFAITAGEPTGVAPRNTSIEITGPDGTVLDTNARCPATCQVFTAPPITEFAWFQVASVDDAAPAPGAYEMAVDADPNVQMKIAPAWLTFER